MKIEAGKCYLDRNGDLHGPLSYEPRADTFFDDELWWYITGAFSRGIADGLDLVEEYIPITQEIWVNQTKDVLYAHINYNDARLGRGAKPGRPMRYVLAADQKKPK